MGLEAIQGIDWLGKVVANDAAEAAAVAGGSATVMATDAEAITGSSTTLGINPANLQAVLQGDTRTLTGTALGTVRAIHGQITASASAIASGTIAGTRGLVTLSGTITAGGAFLYGAQGKLAIGGTMNHADARLCAGLSQLDATGGTLTAGQLSGHWIDIVGVTGAGGGQFNAIRVTTNATAKPNAIMFVQSDASFLFDLSTPSGGAQSFVAAAGTGANSAGVSTGGVASKVMKVELNDGDTYYIPLFSSNA